MQMTAHGCAPCGKPHADMCGRAAQYRLLDTRWPRAVLRLPACRELRGADGLLAFRGPRVRMGIHFAAEGTIAHR